MTKRAPRILAASCLAIATVTTSLALAQTEGSDAFDAEADMAERVEQIGRYNDGPEGLNAVIVHSLTAGFKAREATGTGPMNGRSVLVKDNTVRNTQLFDYNLDS